VILMTVLVLHGWGYEQASCADFGATVDDAQKRFIQRNDQFGGAMMVRCQAHIRAE